MDVEHVCGKMEKTKLYWANMVLGSWSGSKVGMNIVEDDW